MTSCSLLLDRDIQAFIQRSQEIAGGDTGGSVESQREAYAELCRSFHAGRPDGVEAIDKKAGGVPARVYTTERPPKATVIYIHGGGFVLGGLDSHDDVCAEICDQTGCMVVSPDYRLAPENKHPAAYEDCLSAARWALSLGRPLVLAGDSAGGCLAACVCHAMRGEKATAGQVLIYPMLGAEPGWGSFVAHADAPLLSARDVAYYERSRAHGEIPRDDPTFAPLFDSDFSGLPPTTAFSAERDPLSDDAKIYCKRIKAAGGKASWRRGAGLVHGFLRARRCSQKAKRAFSQIIKAIGECAQGRNQV